ncbi:MAG TPA: NUDIX domain-containing protein [Candidatus Diapherotrites archaeon]|uniref:NUDIX domain-containing protein n=1 Tax=Candidatus Iainarchaeum sp. TaxID=3101447 RepID=A0A7J4IZM7_9ARCH|nr:NUDIX domain-containing protein [Candidatus Diapherotrites archaeon]
MNEKHGVTAIIFDERDAKRYFLLLHRALNWSGWEFCKGGIDQGEDAMQAVLREVKEETGIADAKVISVMPIKIKWIARGMKFSYTPFILQAPLDSKIDLQSGQKVIEHNDYKWATEEEVEGMLTHADNKKVFKQALGVLDSGTTPKSN